MANILDRPIRKIAIFRALKLGDFLLFVPALRALRRAFPDATIDYIGLPWNKELVGRFDKYVDTFIEFPGFPGLPEQDVKPGEVLEFLADMQSRKYDLVLQMHGSGTVVNPMVELFGAKQYAGFAPADGYWPNHDFFIEYPEDDPQITKNLRLLRFLGIEHVDSYQEFPVTSADYDGLASVPGWEAIKDAPYAVLHPGSITARPWPAGHFAAIANACVNHDLKIVLTGTAGEQPLVKAVAEKMTGPSVDLSGKTGLGELAVLLKESRLVVANDTGVAHLAVAVDAPSVTVFTSTDPAIWGPLDRTIHKVISGGDAETPTAAISAAESLLSTERSSTS